MALTKLHTLAGLKFDTTVIGAVQNSSLDTGLELVADETSGEPYLRYIGVRKMDPSLRFSSKQIEVLIGEFDSSSLWTDISGLAAGLIAYWQQIESGGTRVAGANSMSATFTDGIIVPRTISVSGTDDVTMDLEAFPVSDGVTDPYAVSQAATIPAVTDTERFGMGPVKLSNKTITGVTDVTIDFGLGEIVMGTDGDYANSFAAIRTILSTISITTTDLQQFQASAFPLEGLAGTHANTILYFRARASGNTYDSDITASHIKVTAAGHTVVRTGADASGNDDGTNVIEMTCAYDGSNLPLTFTTSSAIT
jgi:hypothetical protein